MRQLADILEERINKEGGKASLGRKLGVTGEAILQYTKGAMPSFSVAIKWMEVFNENLIDLVFADEKPSIASEPVLTYESESVKLMMKDLIEAKKQIISLQEELEKLKPDGVKS